MGPLDGFRVVDMSSIMMGPLAAQTLGEYGAEVIKVEPPGGDLMRQVGPMRNAGMGPMYLLGNRAKRSACLDLKSPAGYAAIERLIKTADILLYNIRPQAMSRLRLDYETVEALNPAIVYAGVFGYGQDGPYASKPAYDDLIQGAVTFPYLNARASGGEPRYVPCAIVDRLVGVAAVGAILATLLHREKTGRGQRVDIPMFETAANIILGDHLGGLTFEPPLDGGGYQRQLSPHRKPMRTKDGYICTLIYSDKQWNRFLHATDYPDALANNPDFANFADRAKHIDAAYAALNEVFLERTTDEWIEILEGADIPVMPMHDLQSILQDPHLKEIGFFEEVDHPHEGKLRTTRVPASWSHTPVGGHRPAPRQGEHTIEILREAGLDDSEIRSMLDSGAASIPDDQSI